MTHNNHKIRFVSASCQYVDDKLKIAVIRECETCNSQFKYQEYV